MAFCDVTTVNLYNNVGTETSLKDPLTTRKVANVLTFTDYKQRIITFEIFEGSISHADCLRRSAFYRKYLEFGTDALGSFRCRGSDICGHYIEPAIVCDHAFAPLADHPNIIITKGAACR